MKYQVLTAGIATASLVTIGSGRIATPYKTPLRDSPALVPRALPANTPHGYTPQVNDCPSDRPTIRDASSLSDQEVSWLKVRRKATIDPMKDLLGRLNITSFDTNQYIDKYQANVSNLPNIGIAVSGGGYRAMLNGAGVLEAFDSRTPNSTSTGQLGGLMQSATYLSALSGGSWLVGSLYTNNFTSIDTILSQDTNDSDSGDLWQFSNSIFQGPETGGIQSLDTAGYYADLVSDVEDKDDAGFNVTITDYWGRALSYQLVNATNGGPSYTFSSIADQDFFTSGSVPLPLIVSDGRAPGQVLVTGNATVYTFSPWELGSEDPTVFGFVPLEYIGTKFSAGLTATDQCVTGFDNVGIVMGTSSSLFNTLLTTVNGANSTGLFSEALQEALEHVLTDIGSSGDDIADWPNPFYGYNNDSNPNAQSIQLTLVDGGEDLQNIPLHPLIQPNRDVDVIFAVDSSADTNATYPTSGSAENWPAGIALVATYERSLSPIQNGTAFPSIPDENTFFNLGLNNKPTFFGCDASNLTGPAPLIVYLPNAPYVYNSNVSTFDLSYNDTERDDIVLNGYNLATQGNGTLDSQWPTCVGCAILSRSLDRTGTSVPDACKQCFDKYCWNGTMDSSQPTKYEPALKLNGVNATTSGAGALTTSTALTLLSAALVSLALV